MNLDISHYIPFSISVVGILAFYFLLVFYYPKYFVGNNSIYLFLACLAVILYIYSAYYYDLMDKKINKINLMDYTKRLADLQDRMGLLSLSSDRNDDDDYGFYIAEHENKQTLDSFFRPSLI